MKLNVYYDSETDTLSLWNGQPASEGADVAENLTADFDAEGEVVGFTLEHAAETLKAVSARPFRVWGAEGLTPATNEHALETLKAVGASPFSAWGADGLTPVGNKHALEMLKATDVYPFFALDHEGLTPLTPVGSEHALEMLKATGAHPLLARGREGSPPADSEHALENQESIVAGRVIILNPEGLTLEDIAKQGIYYIASSPEDSQFADSGK